MPQPHPAAPTKGRAFEPGCTRCRRLAGFLEEVRGRHPDYHCAPVPSFGAPGGRLLVVGLAPGLHGANRTGRPFTGDHAGILLYETLHRFGFASAAVSSHAGDGLLLAGCRITNAVRCLPPANRPLPAEVRECNEFLAWELARLPGDGAIVALGAVAHGAVLAALGLRRAAAPFSHAARHVLPDGRLLVDSYHCSRYNTQTRRLTPAMFAQVFAAVRQWLDG